MKSFVNSRQRIVLIFGLLIIFGMALFPPWRTPREYGEAVASYVSFSGHRRDTRSTAWTPLAWALSVLP